MKTITLGPLAEIKDPGSKGYCPDLCGRDQLFLVRSGSLITAFRDRCPHVDGVALPFMKDRYLDMSGNFIVCAAHGARFNKRTGECIAGPCLGKFLEPVPVTVTEDLTVTVEINPTLFEGALQ